MSEQTPDPRRPQAPPPLVAAAPNRRPDPDSIAPRSARTPDPDPDADTARHARVGRGRTNRDLRGLMLALIGVAALLLLLLIAWGVGWVNLPGMGVATTPTRDLLLGDSESGVLGAGELPTAVVVAAPPALPGEAGPTIQQFYFNRGGERVFGAALGPVELVNGRAVQYFERARLEYWPEHAGTPYLVQPGLIGVEYTTGRDFPSQEYFVSRSDLVYFPVPGHGVGEPFLSYWQNNGNVEIFGLPISEAFEEELPSGERFLVQYFERARLEYHPEATDPAWQVQVGLLGSAIYRKEPRPDVVPPAPTPVPMP